MILNLDKAKEVTEGLSEYSTNPEKLYVDLQKDKKSFTQHLEELDPSERDEEGNNVSNLDAFDRHLIVNDIQLSGPNQLSVEQLSDRVQYIVPELVLRHVREGMVVADKYSYQDIIAQTVPARGVHYHPLYIPNLNVTTAATTAREKSLGARSNAGQGGEFPVLSVRTREKDIVVSDIGRTVEAEYAIIKDYGWSEFAVLLRLIGGQLAADKLQNIYDLGITGDGTVGAATNTFNGVAGTLAYTDLVTNETAYNSPFQMNVILGPQQTVRAILALAQFQDPEAGWKYQNTGQVVTPMGAKLKQVNPTPGTTPTGTVAVTMDKRYACKEIVNQILSVEAEKIIQRKFEAATISEKSAFCIIADGALRRIVWT